MATENDELTQIAREWIGLWQGGDLGNFDEIHDPSFIDHSPSGRTQDREGFRCGIEELYRAFPDFMGCIEDLVVDPVTEKVAIRWSATGTHRGAYLGVPPTGRQINFAGVEIIEVKNHRLVARWGEWDGLDIKDQLTSGLQARRRTAHHLLTILAVEDLRAAARFYKAAFGWPARVEVPVYVEFELPDDRGFGLYQREAYARNTGQIPVSLSKDEISGTELYFHCSDVVTAIERMKSAGARELSALAARDWGDEAANFADPEGNVLVVARPLQQHL